MEDETREISTGDTHSEPLTTWEKQVLRALLQLGAATVLEIAIHLDVSPEEVVRWVHELLKRELLEPTFHWGLPRDVKQFVLSDEGRSVVALISPQEFLPTEAEKREMKGNQYLREGKILRAIFEYQASLHAKPETADETERSTPV